MIGIFLSVLGIAMSRQSISGLVIILGLYLMLAHREKGKVQNILIKILGLVLTVSALIPGLGNSRVTVIWQPYNTGILTQAAAEGKPVALDFFASWCVPCIQLDERTYSDPLVIQELERFVRVRADVTRMDSPEVQEIIARHLIQSIPVLLFIDTDGREIVEARVDGFVEPEELVKILQSLRLKKL